MREKQKYGLRKLSIGVVSCFLGSVVYFGAGLQIQAEELDHPETISLDGQENIITETNGNVVEIEEEPSTNDTTQLEINKEANGDVEIIELSQSETDQTIVDEKQKDSIQNNKIQEEDPDAVLHVTSQRTVEVYDEESLRNAITNGNDVRFKKDIFISAPITIPDNYTGVIIGDHYRLVASASPSFSSAESAIFVVSPGTDVVLEIQNLIIDGSNCTRALLMGSGNAQAYGTVEFLNTTIQDCAHLENASAENGWAHGGAIFAHGGKLVFEGSSVYDCYASDNPTGTPHYSLGGAIYTNNTDIEISSSFFYGNHLTYNGAQGGQFGGSICMDSGTLNIETSHFFIGDGFENGGALYLNNVQSKIQATDFHMNIDTMTGARHGTSGGMIFILDGSHSIQDCNFVVGGDGKGRVMHAGGMIDVVSSLGLGGSDTVKKLEIIRSNFHYIGSTANSASLASSGGMICFEDGTYADEVLIEGCTFVGGKAEGQNAGRLAGGGAISFGTTAAGSAFVRATIQNCVFSSGTYYNMLTAGGDIMISYGNRVSIYNSTFIDPGYHAAQYGGAIYNAGYLFMDSVSIDGFRAYHKGGAIYNAKTGDLTMHHDCVIQNSFAGDALWTGVAYGYGGGIYNEGILRLGHAMFSGNSAANKYHQNSQNENEYGGSNLYLAKGSTTYISRDTVFDSGDVRVLDGKDGSQSSIILTGERTTPIYVSISETSKKNEEDLYRYIGYKIAQGTVGYTLSESDLDNILYLSKDTNASQNPNELGKWVFVFDPENNTIVVGQHATLIYDPNEENFTLNGRKPEFDNGVQDLNNATKNVEDTSIVLYKSNNGIRVTPISETPKWTNGGSSGYKIGNFDGWYKSGDVPTMNDMKTTNTHTKAFGIDYGTFDFFTSSDFNSDGKIDTLLSKAFTVYGAYAPYTVTYEKGNVNSASNMPQTDKFYNLENYTVPGNPSSTKRFKGWKVTTDSSSTLINQTFNASETFVMRPNDLVLTAQWESYKVTYKYSGDIPTGVGLPTEQGYDSGTTINVAPAPTKEGYTFMGWNSNDVTINNGSFIMPEKDIVIEGVWRINSNNVRYEYLGDIPSDAPSLLPARNYNYNIEVTLASNPSVVGYTFLGWETNDANITNGSFMMPDNAVVIRGTWKINTHNVRYEYSGDVPSGASSLPTENSHNYNSTVSVAPIPTIEGYTFSGWNSEEVSIDNGTFTMPDKEVVLKGSWTINSHNVRYEYSGNIPTGAPSVPSGQGYDYNSIVSLADIPTMEGYTFSGWSSEEVIIDNGTFTMPDKEVVLKGSWTINFHNVRYEYSGDIPSGVPVVPSGQSYDYNSIVSLADIPTMEGYTFSGWSSEEVVIDNGTFTMPDKEVILVGNWIKNKEVKKEEPTIFIPEEKEKVLEQEERVLPKEKKKETPTQVQGGVQTSVEGFMSSLLPGSIAGMVVLSRRKKNGKD